MTLNLDKRIRAWDGETIGAEILSQGHARLPLLAPEDCTAIAALWNQEDLFRKHVDMGRHSYGEGHYRYFAAPFPAVIQDLRTSIFAKLSPVASQLDQLLGIESDWPPALDLLEERCAAAGQSKPTPLLLRYESGGYNRMHRDLYGEIVFPLQATLMLSTPGRDFDGGEFLLIENTPRKQALARSIALKAGELIVFPSAVFPTRGARGWVRAQMRHGVSPVLRGQRATLGLIFHNAA